MQLISTSDDAVSAQPADGNRRHTARPANGTSTKHVQQVLANLAAGNRSAAVVEPGLKPVLTTVRMKCGPSVLPNNVAQLAGAAVDSGAARQVVGGAGGGFRRAGSRAAAIASRVAVRGSAGSGGAPAVPQQAQAAEGRRRRRRRAGSGLAAAQNREGRIQRPCRQRHRRPGCCCQRPAAAGGQAARRCGAAAERPWAMHGVSGS